MQNAGTGDIKEHSPWSEQKIDHENFGFECLHYGGVESNGYVEVTVNKKKLEFEGTVGVVTQDETAREG